MEGFTGLRPKNAGNKPDSLMSPKMLRDEFQHILGSALPDCILPEDDNTYGFKITPQGGLVARVEKGRGIIGKKYHDDRNYHDITLPARMAVLMYKLKNTATDSVTPTDGYVQAKYPIDLIDNNTVGFWIPNKTGNIPNLAVDISSIAVANDLVPTGGLAVVDGHCDFSIQGNGTTGCYAGSNGTGFPLGSTEKHFSVAFTCKNINTTRTLAVFGELITYHLIAIRVVNARLQVGGIGGGSDDTAFDFIAGNIYIIDVGYDGTVFKVYVNGVSVATITQAINITNPVMYVGKYMNATEYSSDAIHYIELRNKMRTPARIAEISNKLLLPCSYTKPMATYPTIATSDLTTAYHEYKFDETTGTAVVDSAGTMSGTATGTTIVTSDIGLGNARKFNGTSDKISLGNYTFPSAFTVVGSFKTSTTGGYIFGNRDSSANGGNVLTVDSSGKLRWISGGANSIYSQGTANTGNLVFFAFSFANGQMTNYLNSPIPEAIQALSQVAMANNPLYIGTDGYGSVFQAMTMEYFNTIPRNLSQLEIAQYYNALMKTGKADVTEVLPVNSISLGYAKTNSTAVVEIDTDSYKFGRREGAVGGNRKVFLGWKYAQGSTSISWNNIPFSTLKHRLFFVSAIDSVGTGECPTLTKYYNASGWTGISIQIHTINKVTINIEGQGIGYYNGSMFNSGYIGCYAEIIE